jgi:hypothetical protein
MVGVIVYFYFAGKRVFEKSERNKVESAETGLEESSMSDPAHGTELKSHEGGLGIKE